MLPKKTGLKIVFLIVTVGVLGAYLIPAPVRQSFVKSLGITPPKTVVAKQKPICSQIIVPAGTDCTPQHMAGLPPDPGPEGMLTVEGIDADKDGIRDDVQRFIAENFGDSPRAVRVLTMLAENNLMEVRLGDDLGREETQKLAQKIMNAASCYSQATPELRDRHAMDLVRIRVINTPERTRRAYAFQRQLAHQVYSLGNETTTELCGFDPATIQ